MSQAAVPVTGRKTLSGEILSAVAGLGRAPAKLLLGKGELISLQSGRGAGIHIVSRGRVKTLRFSDQGKVMLLDLLGPGDLFGDLSFLSERADSEPVQSYAEAFEPSELYSIPAMMFERLLRLRPSLAVRIVGLTGDRCRSLERRLEARVCQKVPARLARQLLDLAGRFGERTSEGTLLPFAVSQQDLANFIGASREIVSLTLSDFRRRGVVRCRGRKLVLDTAGLRQVEV